MQRHIKKIHEGEKPNVCAFLNEDGMMCGMGFDTPLATACPPGEDAREEDFRVYDMRAS